MCNQLQRLRTRPNLAAWSAMGQGDAVACQRRPRSAARDESATRPPGASNETSAPTKNERADDIDREDRLGRLCLNSMLAAESRPHHALTTSRELAPVFQYLAPPCPPVKRT